jgi:hypothetical protein
MIHWPNDGILIRNGSICVPSVVPECRQIIKHTKKFYDTDFKFITFSAYIKYIFTKSDISLRNIDQLNRYIISSLDSERTLNEKNMLEKYIQPLSDVFVPKISVEKREASKVYKKEFMNHLNKKMGETGIRVEKVDVDIFIEY